MSDATTILSQIESGAPQAVEQLLPLVYDELRQIAANLLTREKPNQTLQATALVHEAYLRLVGGNATFNNRRHFMGAAAEAMRRILVEQARRKKTVRHGGQWKRNLESCDLPDAFLDPAEALVVDELFTRLAAHDPRPAEVAKLRFFLDLTLVEIGEILGTSPSVAQDDWTYARAWLRRAWKMGNRT